jgi:hypothetical protein
MNIDNVTLVTVETMYHNVAKRAMEETLARVPFKHAMVFSDQDFLPGAKHVPIKHGNMEAYCNILLHGMLEHVETEFVIFQQWDAMVHDGSKWQDEFLKYDYIGATWPWRESNDVGNGGFSLRSRRLLEELQAPHMKMDLSSEHGVQEDNYISIVWRPELESKGIKYAPSSVANQFSMELNPAGANAMAHHGYWNVLQYMPKDTVDFFVTNRPPGLFKDIHRAHHSIMALANTNRVDLIDLIKDEVRQCPQFGDLLYWLHSEPEFPNKYATLTTLLP